MTGTGETRCQGLLGLLLGHRYEPRYHLAANSGARFKGTLCAEEAIRMAEAMKDRMYVGDVCRRCGHRTEVAQ